MTGWGDEASRREREKPGGAAIAQDREGASPGPSGTGLRVAVDGLPPCLLPAGVVVSDLWTEGFVGLAEAFEDRVHLVDDRHRTRGEPCRGCTRDGCPGVFRTYLDRYGDAELSPITAPRGSSLDFVDLGPVPAFEPRRCPARQGRVPHADARLELLVRRRGRTRLYRARADDFTEWEIQRIRGWEQVYAPKAGAVDPRDFRTSLEKLRLAAVCSRCDHRRACGGVWVAEGRDVFQRDQEALDDVLARVSGRVLDVGCGAGLYPPVFSRAVRCGRVRLTGMDPDPRAGLALDRAGLPATFLCQAIEELAGRGRAPDQTGSPPRSGGRRRDRARTASDVEKPGDLAQPEDLEQPEKRWQLDSPRGTSGAAAPRRAKDKKLDSTGSSPDPGQRVEPSGSGGSTELATQTELLSDPPAQKDLRFDHVISIRAWSHFRDVDRAAGAIARVLRRGGLLVLVGDTPLALVRSQAQARRSRQDPSLVLEHLRNQDAEQSQALLERHPFRLVERRDPLPRGSNLWWLVLRRR